MTIDLSQREIARYCLCLIIGVVAFTSYAESAIDSELSPENSEYPLAANVPVNDRPLAISKSITRQMLLNKLLRLERFGVTIPATLVSSINRIDETDQETARHLHQWATWLLESPEKLGELSYVNERLIAGNLANIQQRILVGARISSSGGVLIAKHWLHPVQFQLEDLNQSNFLRVTSSNSEVEFESTVEVMAGIHGGLDNQIELPYFRVIKGSLEIGDELVIEHRNLRLPEVVTERFSLPVYFRQTAEGKLTEFKGESLTINAGTVTSAELIVPTYIRPGIEFSAKLFLSDKHGNLAEGRMPSFDLSLGGKFHQRIPAGNENSHLFEGLILDYGDTQLIEVASSGGGIRASSNPFRLVNTRKKILWGEPSASLNLGEGSGIFIRPQLDFSIASVHDDYLTKSRWQSVQGPKSWIWGREFLRGGFHQIVSSWWEEDIQSQTQLVAKMFKQDVLSIASAARPVDDRFLNNRQTRLVELVANRSHFETQAKRLLKRGYRLGFTGTNHSHLLPLGARVNSALTAVITKDGEDWLTAFKRGSTYVTTGNRLLLEFSVNNSQAGERAVSDDVRVIEGRVQGTFGLHKIEIVKNGDIIHTELVSRVLDDESQGLLKVTFYSESAPYNEQRDLPRNGREWIGFFRSEATLSNVEAPGFIDSARQGIFQNENNRVDFITWTRGTYSSFMLGFEMAREVPGDVIAEDTVFELNLREAHEEFDVKPFTRKSSAIPRARHLVSLFDLNEGPVKRHIKVNGYSDEITLEFVNSQSPSSASFKFVDTSLARDGDYYYVRVQQLDDQMAWSSPVFIGGYDQP